jgi:hypothetical protein
LLAGAVEHGVLGLLVDGLQSGVAGPLGADVDEALAICLEGLAINARRAHAQLAEILHLLASRGLEAMPFKGPVLALAYADPALRPCRDLDLMVRAADVPGVVACLQEAGFTHERHLDGQGLVALRRYAGEYIMFRAGDLPVEPHWLPAPWTMAFDIDMEGLWRRAQPSAVLGAACSLPSPEDHFLLLALHGAKEQWHKLKWIADLPVFLAAHPDLDVAGLRRIAADSGCRRIVDLAFLLSHLLFQRPTAMPVADPTTHRLAGVVLERLDQTAAPLPTLYALRSFQWDIREQWRDRMRYALRTLFTPRVSHYARLPIPTWLRWLYIPLMLPWDHVLTPLIGLVRRWRLDRSTGCQDGRPH